MTLSPFRRPSSLFAVLAAAAVFLLGTSTTIHGFVVVPPLSTFKAPPHRGLRNPDEHSCFSQPATLLPRPLPSPSSSSQLGAVVGAATTVVSDLAAVLFRSTGNVPFLPSLGINAVLFTVLFSKLTTMLTPTGLAHSMALGTLLWMTLGWKGWIFCVLYLFFGQAVTKVRFADKEKRGLAEKRGGRRGPENVWGSAATGLVCAACASQGQSVAGLAPPLFLWGYVASMATKLADTFASEIGKAYGKTTILITTLQRVEPGTEGAVSLEGTAAAAVGGLLLSLVGRGLGLIPSQAIPVTTAAAFIATNVESVLGATLQEKKGLAWMTNEVVNFINTVIGAGIAMAVGSIILAR